MEKFGLLQPFAQSGGEEGAPRLPAPLPTGSIPPPFGEGGLLAIPHPHTSPWSLSSQPSRSGAQLTQRREGQGGRGKEVVGGAGLAPPLGETGTGYHGNRRAARQLAGGGGGRVGGREGSKLGTAPRSGFFITPPPVLSFLENIQAHTCPFSQPWCMPGSYPKPTRWVRAACRCLHPSKWESHHSAVPRIPAHLHLRPPSHFCLG